MKRMVVIGVVTIVMCVSLIGCGPKERETGTLQSLPPEVTETFPMYPGATLVAESGVRYVYAYDPEETAGYAFALSTADDSDSVIAYYLDALQTQQYDEIVQSEVTAAGREWKQLEAQKGDTHFDVAISLTPADDGMTDISCSTLAPR
jgi:hypothetical protein